ncbi:4a-hydroxytetrahydrobiopterin dehydratase [Candidatus Saccharibacteria bacterium]|nr:4a-hydroxytetrahydrobiopterin dehydratase [Candidatus Saccharibacteria bacterium]
MNDLTFEALSTAWSRTDSEGLTRVIDTDSFRTSFVMVAKIGRVAEDLKYYPELVMSNDTVIIKIDDSDEAKALQLARLLDELLDETVQKANH